MESEFHDPLSVEELASLIPSGPARDILQKLLNNVAREPKNPKFRKIKLSNVKIKQVRR